MSQTLDSLIVELRADVKGLQTSLNSAAADVQRFSNKASTNVDAFQASIGRARTAVLSLGTAWAAFRIGKGIVDAGVQIDAMHNKMVAATGGADAAANSLAFVREEANRLGLDIRTASDGFAGFAASSLRAGLTLQQTKDIFTGVSEAATSMRLPAEQVSLVFKALEQMAGKGTVSMEELRGQLGDALPGSFEIAAKAMGKTTAEFTKMVGNGEVLSSDFLPKFGAAIKKELGGSVEEASQGAQAAFNRLGNAFFDLQAKMANAGFLDVVTNAVNDLTETLNDPATVDGLKGFASLLADIMSAAMSAASALGSFYNAANKAIEKAGDSVFAGVFGDEGAAAIALARRAKANGLSMDSQKAIDNLQKNGGFKYKPTDGVGSSGLSSENGFTATGGASPAAVSGSYTLGKPSQPVESDTARKARDRAAQQADQLKQQMQDKVSGFQYSRADPATQAGMDVDAQQEMLKEALDAKAITEQEYRDLSLQAETDYQQKQTDIRQQATDQEVAMRSKALNNIMGLLQVFAGKNKAIAIAMLAFDKARAIAQTIMETHVAAAAALKYDPTGATSARVTMLGYANVAAIAATGIAQLATMGAGGGDSGGSSSFSGGSSSGGASSSGSTATDHTKTMQITLIGSEFANYSKNQIRDFIDLLNDAQRDGSRVEVKYS